MKILCAGHSFIIDANRIQWKDLALLGHEVDLLSPDRYGSALEANLKFQRNEKIDEAFHQTIALPVFLSKSNSLFFFSPWKLFKLLRETKYDSIILMQETWSLCLFFFVILKLFTTNRTTALYLGITQNLKKKKYFFLRFFEQFNCFFCRGILGCCDETQEVLVWKGIKTKWFYFPFSYAEELLVRPCELKKNKLVLGYMGRLEEEKGLAVLKQAFLELSEEMGDEIEMVIAGAGSLELLFHHHPQIHFMGRVKHTDIKQFYENINIFILPSESRPFWKEQFGRVLVESVASKRLVIGSNSGAIPEVLSKMGIHSVFQEGQVKDLKRAIRLEMAELHSVDLEQKLERRKKLCKQNFESKNVAIYLDNIISKQKEDQIW